MKNCHFPGSHPISAHLHIQLHAGQLAGWWTPKLDDSIQHGPSLLHVPKSSLCGSPTMGVQYLKRIWNGDMGMIWVATKYPRWQFCEWGNGAHECKWRDLDEFDWVCLASWPKWIGGYWWEIDAWNQNPQIFVLLRMGIGWYQHPRDVFLWILDGWSMSIRIVGNISSRNPPSAVETPIFDGEKMASCQCSLV